MERQNRQEEQNTLSEESRKRQGKFHKFRTSNFFNGADCNRFANTFVEPIPPHLCAVPRPGQNSST